MKRVRVGLNGFGRIGRAFARIALTNDLFDIVVINTRKTQASTMSYLLKYDTVYRTFDQEVGVNGDSLVVGGKTIPTVHCADIESIPWSKYDVDVVIDATGAYVTHEDLHKHLGSSVKKVILTSPSKDDIIPHVVLGVNDMEFDFKNHSIISNCSCTTNCASPLFKVLHDSLSVIKGELTTIHAVTLTQSLLDDAGKSFDRGRAAFQNIIPTTSGAAKAVVKTIPSLKNKLEVMSVRVPVPTVSMCDATVLVEKSTTVEEVNHAFKVASETSMKDVLHYATETLVSSDYIGSPYSCIFDSNYTKVIDGNMVKVIAWYDNEWGYACRLSDLVIRLGHFV